LQEYQQKVEDGIGQVARAFAPRYPPLVELDLCTTHMTPTVWHYVTQLTHLQLLEVFTWDAAMTAEHFQQLGHFEQLRTIRLSIRPREYSRSPLPCSAFWPSLLQCKQLTSVCLGGGLSISVEQLQQLLRCLPLLRKLRLESLFLESLAPLTESSISELIFSLCHDVTGEPADIRRMLPAMPSLTQLSLKGWIQFAFAPDREALDVAVLTRCPD
jgi:hypothetical protein